MREPADVERPIGGRELVRKRILEPLGMTSSSITLSADRKKRLAAGYDAALRPVKNWDLDALAGAGATTFVEAGPGDVLTRLAKRVAPGTEAVAVGSPEAAEGFVRSPA